MRHISLAAPEEQVWLRSSSGRRYIPLGRTPADKLSALALDRIAHRTAGVTQDVWGTLGPWDDASPKGWMGALRLSNLGTDSSTPTTSGGESLALIESVSRTTAMPSGARIRERFVDLSELAFANAGRACKLSEQPALRLTLFVRPDEGALVFLQHGPLGEDGVDFLTPESTGPDHSCSGRDRLDYRVPLFFEGGLSSVVQESSGELTLECARVERRLPPYTVLKLLTFQRVNSPSQEVVKRALRRLGRDKSQLWRWDLQRGAWQTVEPQEVKRDLRTLLFLHGTFSSTSGSFGQLAEEGTWSWLQNMSVARQRYQQLLAFDHDTLFEGLATNAAQLEASTGGRFARPLDVVTHSRGGLLAKHLAIGRPGFEIERAAMTACANGVGYLRTLDHIARFLSVLRRLLRFAVAGDIVVALAQHSVDFIAKLPGLAVMRPSSDELDAVLRTPIQPGRTQTLFLPIVGDYDRRLVEQERFFRRFAMNGLDLIIKAILGEQHDWVVGTHNQGIVAEGTLARLASRVPLKTWHTEYYRLPEVRSEIEAFLLE